MEVEMTIRGLMMDPVTQMPIVILKDVSGDAVLPIWVVEGGRTLMVERYPWTAEPPLDELAATPFPKLVVSGAHSPAFDAVCDVLVERLGATRAVLPGAGHSVQRLGEPFNELLAAFVRRAERAAPPRPSA